MAIALRTFRRRLARDARGVTVVEFGMVAPFLALLVLGISDFAWGFSQRHQLQQAVHRTLEMAHLGAGSSDYAYLIPEAAASAGVPETSVRLDKWLECDGRRTVYEGTCAAGEQTARYLQLNIASSFKSLFGATVYRHAAADGTVPISAQSALRVQ